MPCLFLGSVEICTIADVHMVSTVFGADGNIILGIGVKTYVSFYMSKSVGSIGELVGINP